MIRAWEYLPIASVFRPRSLHHRILGGAAHGTAGEFGKGDPHHPDHRDAAMEHYWQMRRSLLANHGYLHVGKPTRDGDGYVIDVDVTDLGETACAALDADWVWSTEDEAPSESETVQYWNRYLDLVPTIVSERYAQIQNTTLPILRPVRERCDMHRVDLARRALDRVTREDDPIFAQILLLPERPPFDTVRREAFLRRIAVWAPK